MHFNKDAPRMYAERFYLLAAPMVLLIGLFYARGYETIAYGFTALLVLGAVNKIRFLAAARRERRDAQH